MSESTIIEKTSQPATIGSIADDLSRLGVEEGSLLLVHSSLSSLGWVSGGAVAVVEALRKVVGPTGTLVMPTYSAHLSDPAFWENPPVPESWWPIIRETMPPYDSQTTPTTAMGAIAELFRTLPDSVRGNHPLFSLTACGPLAEEIVHPHTLEAGFGEQAPVGRIYQCGGQVLLLGVNHDRNTSLHLAEHRAFGGTAGTVQNGTPILVDGQRQWGEFEQLDIDLDFVQLGERIRTTTNIVKDGKVALANSQLMSQRDLVDFAVQEWRSNVEPSA